MNLKWGNPQGELGFQAEDIGHSTQRKRHTRIPMACSKASLVAGGLLEEGEKMCGCVKYERH